MKSVFSSLVFVLLTLVLQAQSGVYIYGQLWNSPGFPVEISLDIQSNPPVSGVVIADATGNIPYQLVATPNQNWDILTTSFLDCDSTISSYTYNLDSLDLVTEVAIYPWYCLNVLLSGCTDPNATNYNPQATIEDGSCEYNQQCDENLVTILTNWDQVSEFQLSFYDYMGNLQENLNFSNVDTMPHSICVPDGCYAVEFFYANGAGELQILVDDALVYSQFLQPAPPTGGGTGFPLALNSNCTVGCNFQIGLAPSADSCFSIISIPNLPLSTAVYWDFGDGTTANATPNVAHNFGASGDYQICAIFFTANCDSVGICLDAYVTSCSDQESVFGCTDSTALNYNPAATADDGSCTYLDPCDLNYVEIVIQTQYWAEEIAWTLSSLSGEMILSSSINSYENYSTYQYFACLADGCYQFLLEDSYGDGWNDASFQISIDGVPTLSGTLSNGYSQLIFFDINGDNCIPLGSENDLCINATPLLQGTTLIDNSEATMNENIYGACWGFGQGEGEQTSIWYSFTTPAEEAYVHIEAFGDGTNTLTDTQFGLFQQCGGQMIHCDGNSGDGLFSAFTFQCGELDTNATYILMIDGWNGDAGTCFLDFEMSTGCYTAFYGCTDSLANNYDPMATIDDGTCNYSDCAQYEAVLNLQAATLSDIAYYISNSDGAIIESAIVTTSDMLNISLCLPAGCYSIEINSSGNPIQYELSVSGNAVLLGQLWPSNSVITGEFSLGGALCGSNDPCNPSLGLYTDSGSCTVFTDLQPASSGWGNYITWDYGDGQISTGYGFSYHVYSQPGDYAVCATFSAAGCANTTVCDSVSISCAITYIWGCTDPEALNYNPLADYNDGSCNYSSADCIISFDVIPDTTGLDVFYVIPSTNIFGADSVLWSFGDGYYSSDLFPTHEYTSDGPFNLCLTVYFLSDSSTCIITYCALLDGNDVGGPGLLDGSFTISILEPEVLAVAENSGFDDIRIWPNPTNNDLHIQYQSHSAGDVIIRLVDLTGRTVIQRNSAVTSLHRETIDVSSLASGVYLVVLQSELGLATTRVVVGR